jgi:hypothetical protein
METSQFLLQWNHRPDCLVSRDRWITRQINLFGAKGTRFVDRRITRKDKMSRVTPVGLI